MVFAGLCALATATALVLVAFEDNIVFFFSPSEVAARKVPDGQRIRLGGLVKAGSYKRGGDGITIHFTITDTAKDVPVQFKGLLPDLFREGQGVVTEGAFKNGVFLASEVLAKHDENYMPAEVAESLKKSGHWQKTKGDDAKKKNYNN